MQKVGMQSLSNKTSTICKNGQEEPVVHYEILNTGGHHTHGY